MQIKLYHNTHPDNLPSIRKRGLMPGAGAGEDGAKWGKAVWLTTLGPQAGEHGTMVEAELDRADPLLTFVEKLRPGAEWWIYRGTIPPDKLKYVRREQTNTLGTR